MQNTTNIKRKPKYCGLCVRGVNYLDYSDTMELNRFVTASGKIKPRQVTGNCAKCQRTVTRAIKRARIMGLLPFTTRKL